ncbi:MAG: hypothetical protein Q9192_008568, partial [Flavoplaca navasiana]
SEEIQLESTHLDCDVRGLGIFLAIEFHGHQQVRKLGDIWEQEEDAAPNLDHSSAEAKRLFQMQRMSHLMLSTLLRQTYHLHARLVESFEGHRTTHGAHPSEISPTDDYAIAIMTGASTSEFGNVSITPLPTEASNTLPLGAGANVAPFDRAGIADNTNIGSFSLIPASYYGDHQTSTLFQSTTHAAAIDPLLESVAESLWKFRNLDSSNNQPTDGYGSTAPAYEPAFTGSPSRFSQANNSSSQTYRDPSGREYPHDLCSWTAEDHERARRQNGGRS